MHSQISAVLSTLCLSKHALNFAPDMRCRALRVALMLRNIARHGLKDPTGRRNIASFL
ncbi:hypothetical protein Airi02_039700 [Actinoallomurus iriomotensis]|uniref:Uncharacterized protein n=1 Tax=Actinoallomurus iriomotensis TaxID=478107 RepID=A0A9W6S2H1_9ACTN|nr:hypothetical protein Airi02_039700 [Actinoallomurus iriomotensis]